MCSAITRSNERSITSQRKVGQKNRFDSLESGVYASMTAIKQEMYLRENFSSAVLIGPNIESTFVAEKVIVIGIVMRSCQRIEQQFGKIIL